MQLRHVLLRLRVIHADNADVTFLIDAMLGGNLQCRKQLADAVLSSPLRLRIDMQIRRELWRWGRVDGLSQCAEIRALG